LFSTTEMSARPCLPAWTASAAPEPRAIRIATNFLPTVPVGAATTVLAPVPVQQGAAVLVFGWPMVRRLARSAARCDTQKKLSTIRRALEERRSRSLSTNQSRSWTDIWADTAVRLVDAPLAADDARCRGGQSCAVRPHHLAYFHRARRATAALKSDAFEANNGKLPIFGALECRI